MTAWKRKEVIGDCALYLGDCMEIMPTLGKVDAVVTDPPYGIGMARNGRSGGGGTASAKWKKPRIVRYDSADWDSQTADQGVQFALSITASAIIWGGNYYDLPPSSCWLVWDKETNGNLADCELAWTNMAGAVRRLRHLWNGFARKGGETRYGHPTQKPVELIDWCIAFLPTDAGVVMDPFMGSGTTGVACVKAGRKFIGIEIDEGYFDIACERIRKAYAQPDMFIAPTPAAKAEQLGFSLDRGET